MWAIKKQLHERGMKVYELPWGVAIDKCPDQDKLGESLRLQVNEILERFKARTG